MFLAKHSFAAQNAKSADEVVNTIRERGGKVEAWEADLANPKTIASIV